MAELFTNYKLMCIRKDTIDVNTSNYTNIGIDIQISHDKDTDKKYLFFHKAFKKFMDEISEKYDKYNSENFLERLPLAMNVSNKTLSEEI